MAKCLMCNAKKGKRICQIVDGVVCSLCCGTTRDEEQCLGCKYYKSPQESRKYNKIPSFAPFQMEANMEFQNISDVIESALCSVDAHEKFQLKDDVAKQTLERLIDVYHFGDNELAFKSEMIEKCFVYVYDAIKTKIIDTTDIQILIKVLGAIYFVLVRRSKGAREYFNVIQKYVGGENGIRVI